MTARSARQSAKIAPSASGHPDDPAPGAGPDTLYDMDNLDARLGFLMHDVSRLRRNVFDEFMKPMGLTRSQWWVLAYISRHDGLIQSELAGMLDLGKVALGGLIDRLEASCLVERRPDQADRRVKRIHLTRKGVQTIRDMRVKAHALSERILTGLGPKARHALVDHLALVKLNLLALRAELDGAKPPAIAKTRGPGIDNSPTRRHGT